jgi:hypothetical protein
MAAWRDPIVGHVDDILTRTANWLENWSHSVRADRLEGHRLHAVAESEGGPQAWVRDPASAPAAADEAPSPSDDLHDALADVREAWRDLAHHREGGEPVSHARYYERQAFYGREFAKAALRVAVLFDEIEKERA